MGGKSRKSGGVSRALIAHIKSGKLSSSKSTKKKSTAQDEKGHKTIFNES
jgi:hypothetical protein